MSIIHAGFLLVIDWIKRPVSRCAVNVNYIVMLRKALAIALRKVLPGIHTQKGE